MRTERLTIHDVILITPDVFADARGVFVETWNDPRYAAIGIPGPFVQDNHSVSMHRGTIRGLHQQVAPNAQGKLVRCVRGAIWDVAVDVRAGSPTYGQHVGATLTAGNWAQLWVPAGFLHGYCTLEPETDVIYKVTAPYDRVAERGVIWNDPTLAIPWPVSASELVLSGKDLALPPLAASGAGHG